MQALKKTLDHGVAQNAGYEQHVLQVRVVQLNAELEDIKAERDMYKNLYEAAMLSLSGTTDEEEANPPLQGCSGSRC